VLFGEGGADSIDGGGGGDSISGQDGDDDLNGGEGDDHLDGGEGEDTICGGHGNDFVDGGSGNDVILLTSEGGSDVITGGEGADTLDLSTVIFDASVDLPNGIAVISDGTTAQVFEIENVRGGYGRDRLVADDHVNIMIGGEGNDTFIFESLAALINDGGPRDHIMDAAARRQPFGRPSVVCARVLSGGCARRRVLGRGGLCGC
jgi:Ca2+-binding RTX toxin-like protein